MINCLENILDGKYCDDKEEVIKCPRSVQSSKSYEQGERIGVSFSKNREISQEGKVSALKFTRILGFQNIPLRILVERLSIVLFSDKYYS